MGIRRTRMVRARDLQAKQVILYRCVVQDRESGCRHNPAAHKSMAGPVEHRLTLMDVEIHEDNMSAIVMSESYAESKIEGHEWSIWEVLVDKTTQDEFIDHSATYIPGPVVVYKKG